jgi:nucleoside-diphosphate kinase
MAARNDESLLFVVEWFDPSPMMKKKYLLKYFVDQHMVEMVDVSTRKMFLRKSACPKEISSMDFFIGSKISIYSRELEVVDYGDSRTKEKLHAQVQHCVVVLPPSAYNSWGSSIETLNADMLLIRAKSVLLSASQADKVCNIMGISPRNSADLSSGVSVALVFHGSDGFDKVLRIANAYSNDTSTTPPFFSATNGVQSSELLSMLLDSPMPSTATFDSMTCCIVKPHAVKGNLLGPILTQIVGQGYEVSAVQSVQFERKQAEEFYQVRGG